MGANPVQVEVGEFDEGAEEAEEEVVAESRSLPHVSSHPVFRLCFLGLGCGDSLHEVLSQGNAGWGSSKEGGLWRRNGFDLMVRNIL